jgi:phenylalanyl-tRNA synthetase beta chain
MVPSLSVGPTQLGPKNVIGHGWGAPTHAPSKPGSEGPVAGFELFLNDISAPKLRSTRAKPKLVLSEFMPAQRDFAFLADQSVKAADTVKAAAAAEHALVAHVGVLRRRGDTRGEEIGRHFRYFATA